MRRLKYCGNANARGCRLPLCIDTAGALPQYPRSLLWVGRRSSPKVFLRGLSIRIVFLLFSLEVLLLAALAIWRIPFTHPEGDFALNALQVLRTGHVQSTFLPAFYPYIAAHAYRMAGPLGFIVLQAAFYLCVALLVFLAVNMATGHARGAILVSSLLALDPDLLSAIPKATDTQLTGLFLVLILCMCLRLRTQGLWLAALLGMTWGLALSVRPNLALLALPVGYALFFEGARKTAARWLLVACVAFAVMSGANTLAHGAFYLPHNGPYNFFAGANRYTQWSLLHTWNAEASIPLALAAHWPQGLAGPSGSHAYYNQSLNPIYDRLALSFIFAHPLQWLWLWLIKLATLLRPALRTHSAGSLYGSLEMLTSLATPVWLAALFLTHRARRARRQADTAAEHFVDLLFYLAVGAYVLPFLLTNADPRFRTPLDVLVLTHTGILAVRWWARQQARSSVRPGQAGARNPRSWPGRSA